MERGNGNDILWGFPEARWDHPLQLCLSMQMPVTTKQKYCVSKGGMMSVSLWEKSQYYTKLMGGFIFETGSCVSQTDLKFPQQQRVALNFLSYCLHLLNTRILGMSHHTLFIWSQEPNPGPRTCQANTLLGSRLSPSPRQGGF